MGRDLLGREMTESEKALLAAYEELKRLLDRDDLAPCTRANVAEAIAALWQAVNDLALVEDRPSV